MTTAVSNLISVSEFRAQALREKLDIQQRCEAASRRSCSAVQDTLTVDDCRLLGVDERIDRAIKRKLKDTEPESSSQPRILPGPSNDETLALSATAGQLTDSVPITGSFVARQDSEAWIQHIEEKPETTMYDDGNPGLARKMKTKEEKCQAQASKVAEAQHLATLREAPKTERRIKQNFITEAMKVVGEQPLEFEQVAADEVVLRVTHYHAERKAKLQEFLVLASQPLTALRDRLYCLSDHLPIDGVRRCQSAMFFINSDFYVDDRPPDNGCQRINYSTAIVEWLPKAKQLAATYGTPPFRQLSMSKATFAQLSVRLGQQYLYLHQGKCEHFIEFSDIRMLHGNDEHNRNAYPLHHFQARFQKRKCDVCDIYAARVVLYNDSLSSENPTFYCKKCYPQPLHYGPPTPTADGQYSTYELLEGNDFESFEYFHE